MIGKYKLLRAGLGALSLAFLLSCGGGSDVSGGSVSGHIEGDGFTIGGSSGGSSNGDGTGGDGGSSGSASTGGDGSTTTAGNGNDDGSGVGSGGTGVSTADAGTVGAVDGMGSIIVGGLRYNDDNAVIDRRDADAWQLGMTVAVTGTVDPAVGTTDPAFETGVAQKLKSMAQMRGAVDSVDVAGGSFQMLGSTLSVDDETVWADLTGLSNVVAGTRVQVWALPVSPGLLRATRIESQGVAATTLATGTVSLLDDVNKTFQLGSLVVGYASATLPAEGLAVGRIVRVEASAAPSSGRLEATKVEGWYALTTVQGAPVQVEGVIDQFVSKGDFKLMGVAIDASAALVTGGQPDKLNNGVRVVASGILSSNGILVASKVKIRHIPGEGALTRYYDLHGTIEGFQSPSNMRVRTASGGVQRVDVTAALSSASGTGQLQDGQKVRVQGSQVISGVLQVTQLTYE